MHDTKQAQIIEKERNPALFPSGGPKLSLSPERRRVYLELNVPRKDWHQPSGRIIAFAHALVVPQGKFVGKPLRLRPFQMEFIRDVYNPRQRQWAARTDARRSCRSRGAAARRLLAALIILIHLVGPAKRPELDHRLGGDHAQAGIDRVPLGRRRWCRLNADLCGNS